MGNTGSASSRRPRIRGTTFADLSPCDQQTQRAHVYRSWERINTVTSAEGEQRLSASMRRTRMLLLPAVTLAVDWRVIRSIDKTGNSASWSLRILSRRCPDEFLEQL